MFVRNLLCVTIEWYLNENTQIERFDTQPTFQLNKHFSFCIKIQQKYTFFSWHIFRFPHTLHTWVYLVFKLKRCSNKECCKQCRYVMFKGTMTKWPVQKLTQGTTQKLLQHHLRNRHLENIYFCVFRIFLFLFSFFIDNFLKEFSKKCCVTALVRSMTFIGGLNQF